MDSSIKNLEPGDIMIIKISGYMENDYYIETLIEAGEGKEDISHHGSELHENFIRCKDSEGEEHVYGEFEYEWCLAEDYIKELHKKLKEIRLLSEC